MSQGLGARARNLKSAANIIVDEADRVTAIEAAKVADEAIKMGAFAGSGHDLILAAKVEQEARNLLARLLLLYNHERSRFMPPETELRSVVRGAVDRFFDLSARHVPATSSGFPQLSHAIYAGTMEEARGQVIAAAEVHFRYPGIAPWHERHAIVVAAITLVFGAVIEALASPLGSLFDKPGA